MRFSLIVLIVISATGLVGTGATIGIVDYFAGDLPPIDAIQTANLIQTTRILDRNGNLIEAVYHENRTVVPLSKISVKLQRATIDTEDRTFYANSGVDYRRLLIAIVYDLTHRSATLVRGQKLRVVRLTEAGQAWQHTRSRNRANDPDGDDKPAESNVKAGERLERLDLLLISRHRRRHLLYNCIRAVLHECRIAAKCQSPATNTM